LRLELDPEKWIPVFRQDHGPPKIQSMIRKVGTAFSEKIMLQQKIWSALTLQLAVIALRS